MEDSGQAISEFLLNGGAIKRLKPSENRHYTEKEYRERIKDAKDFAMRRDGKICPDCVKVWQWMNRKKSKKTRRVEFPSWVYFTGDGGVCKRHRVKRKIKEYNRNLECRTPLWADHKEIAQIYKAARKSGKEVDHIIPLNGKTASGLHVENNLRVVSKAINRKKSNRLLQALIASTQ